MFIVKDKNIYSTKTKKVRFFIGKNRLKPNNTFNKTKDIIYVEFLTLFLLLSLKK